MADGGYTFVIVRKYQKFHKMIKSHYILKILQNTLFRAKHVWNKNKNDLRKSQEQQVDDEALVILELEHLKFRN